MYLHKHNMVTTLVFFRSRLYTRKETISNTRRAHDVANFYRRFPRPKVWQQHVWTGVRANRHFGRKYNILFFFRLFYFLRRKWKREITFTAVYLWYERIIYFILLLLLLLPIYYTMKYYKVQFTHIII